jgi:hypothetical protein
MISIVYGSAEAGLPNNWAPTSADLANDAPNICDWLFQLPTLPLPLFTLNAWAKQFDRVRPLGVKRGR